MPTNCWFSFFRKKFYTESGLIFIAVFYETYFQVVFGGGRIYDGGAFCSGDNAYGRIRDRNIARGDVGHRRHICPADTRHLDPAGDDIYARVVRLRH